MKFNFTQPTNSLRGFKLVLLVSSCLIFPITLYGWSTACCVPDFWTFPFAYSLTLVTAALLLCVNSLLSWSGATLVSGYIVYDFTYAATQEWSEYTDSGLEGFDFWATFLSGTLLPIWEGMRGVLGVLIFCCATMYLVQFVADAYRQRHL